MPPTIGVLALQGDIREHRWALERLGVHPRPVRLPGDLQGLDGLVVPGGESTTIGRLAERFGLMGPLRSAVAGGLPTLATCAGMILVSASIVEGDQPLLGVLDVVVRRNAFGRQNESFEMDLRIEGPAPALPRGVHPGAVGGKGGIRRGGAGPGGGQSGDGAFRRADGRFFPSRVDRGLPGAPALAD